MKLCIAMCVIVLGGCNVLPVSQDHWALLENPVSHKCIEISCKGCKVEVTGMVAWMSGLTVKGNDVTYKSWGKMCKDGD